MNILRKISVVLTFIFVFTFTLAGCGQSDNHNREQDNNSSQTENQSSQKQTLLDELHKEQKQIKCLDYLVYKMEKTNKINV